MATLLLSAAGAAVGAGFGGTVLGLSGAVIGRAVGATVGRMIDQRVLGAGSQAIDVGRVDRFRLMGASEGVAVPLVWGRSRVAGQVIWATEFQETVTTRGGKGAPQPRTREFGYTVSLAIALCEGEITRVGQIWADGQAIEKGQISIRVYRGDETQLPDPKIAAVEGLDKAPAYRGIAYVVIEDLDLSRFGNRVPQFSFEVVRRAKSVGRPQADLAESIRGVALIPGTGEYALATTRVHYDEGPGLSRSANVNGATGQTDFLASFEQLSEELPRSKAASLVVSWFGTDLRCNECRIAPKVEQVALDGVGMPWRAGGIGRAEAGVVPQVNGRPVYGGTPADAAVIEAIRGATAAGQDVMFYPFILMEQLSGNTLPNPWTGEIGQPILPWRGRITTSLSPDLPLTPDRTAAADAEVAAFLGTAQSSDFVIQGEQIFYSGPADWRYRRFILHYAHLCAIAGGVEAFCIGSELVAATQIRGAGDSFPFVAGLKALAAEVRAILGPNVKISYAADWSEYFGYHKNGEVYFHLDPVWSDPNIDFVGIDNYMPISDWRDEEEHKDQGFGTIYNLAYLRSNIDGGEGFDWYYDSEDGRSVQNRLPITDGDHNEPWVFRYKDLKAWWGNYHHPRSGSTRSASATDWVPMSKPVRFTEFGCAAVNKATNQPNKFIDAKSSESLLPYFSTGYRDEFIQHQYYLAQYQHWQDENKNPVSAVYGDRMLDYDHSYAWAWDTRPFPYFPRNNTLWSDGENYGLGHWLNGRTSSQSLADIVHEICDRASVPEAETDGLTQMVRGFAVQELAPARAHLQPLSLAFGFDAIERDGELRFQQRGQVQKLDLSDADFAADDTGFASVERIRASEPEIAGHVQFGYVDDQDAYQLRTADALFADESARVVSQSETSIVMQGGEAKAIAERWLVEARVARDSVSLDLGLSFGHLGAGDVVVLENEFYRIDRIERRDRLTAEGLRIVQGVYGSVSAVDVTSPMPIVTAPLPVFPVVLDIPLLQETDRPYAPYLAAGARPWPGDVSVWRSSDQEIYVLDTVLSSSAAIGTTQTTLARHRAGIFDDGDALIVRMTTGQPLQSVTTQELLSGANTIAIGDGSSAAWEIVQFQFATLIGPQTYALQRRLRGQLGTDAIVPTIWPSGSLVVVLDNRLRQSTVAESERGAEVTLKFGAAIRGPDDASVQTRSVLLAGNGLRPYAVAHLRATKQPGGDVDLTWIRRTRRGGDSWVSVEVPLAEETEQYVIEVWQSGQRLRQSASSTATWTYTVLQQLADGATGAVLFKVAQVSQSYGAGPQREVAIDL